MTDNVQGTGRLERADMIDKTTRGTLVKQQVRRVMSGAFQVREAAGGTTELEGYASTTEKPYEMCDMFGPYSEVISRGAFGKTLANGADVALLLNHGGLTMARTKPGTLQLAEDDKGLHWSATVDTTRSDVSDMLKAIADGSVDECSFAFRVVQQQWSPDYDERRITEVNMDRGDVCPVNFGANPNTSIGRSGGLDAFRAADVEHFTQRSADDLTAAELRSLFERVRAGDFDLTDLARSAPAARGMSLELARTAF